MRLVCFARLPWLLFPGPSQIFADGRVRQHHEIPTLASDRLGKGNDRRHPMGRPAPAGDGFAAPLTAADLRTMYARNRSPEVRALLWEIARLHTRLRRAVQLASCFPLYGGSATSPSLAIILEAVRRELAEEPCLCDVGAPASTGNEELLAAPYWAAKHAARRRNG